MTQEKRKELGLESCSRAASAMRRVPVVDAAARWAASASAPAASEPRSTADTVAARAVLASCPVPRTLLFPDGQLNRDVEVLVNGRNVAFLAGLDTPLAAGRSGHHLSPRRARVSGRMNTSVLSPLPWERARVRAVRWSTSLRPLNCAIEHATCAGTRRKRSATCGRACVLANLPCEVPPAATNRPFHHRLLLHRTQSHCRTRWQAACRPDCRRCRKNRPPRRARLPRAALLEL